jgi:putative transposase
MWTDEHRRIYRREGDGYPSDLKDAEWARLEPLIPKATPGGRPRKTDMRAAINAILYLLRTGCPWLRRVRLRSRQPCRAVYPFKTGRAGGNFHKSRYHTSQNSPAISGRRREPAALSALPYLSHTPFQCHDRLVIFALAVHIPGTQPRSVDYLYM